MKAVILKGFGGTEVLTLGDLPKPKPTDKQLLVRVHATALNRADILQRQGKYPPPPGDTEILGLEIAGEITELGCEVKDFKIGQRVFGLVGGGGYAEYCVIDAKMAMLIPENWPFTEAAAVPEAFFTANETVFTLGELKAGESILIHAAGSGVGTAAVQMAHYIGATVYGTAGEIKKIDRVISLGATAVINYKTQDFAAEIMRLTQQQGVDVIEDFIGADYFARNLSLLKPAGRLISIGLMGGSRSEIDLRLVLTKRLQIKGSVLRTRSLEDKRAITHRFQERWLPVLKTGKIKPIVHAVFPLDKVREAHELMEANENFGKIILAA